MFFNSVLVIVSFIISFCFGYFYFKSCDTKLIATMTIIKVHHPFDANLEIIPMIIELCQAQDTGRGLEMTSTKIFMPIALVVVIDLAYNQFSQNRTLIC